MADSNIVEDEPAGLESPDVVTKYKMAGDMATQVVNKVAEACVDGAKTVDLCALGDKLIEELTSGVYNKKDPETGKVPAKGVGFPTCVSVNNCICHSSPIVSDTPIVLVSGDVVKIDLAVQIDGYIAPVATTLVVGGGMIEGKKADVMKAAWTAAEVALRMMRPGTKTYAVSDAVDKVAKAFGCTAVEGMLSHQLIKNKIDGEKSVILNPTEQLRKEHKDAEIQENEVYALDMILSTGEGKPREGEHRTTVYKKTEMVYGLRMKASKKTYSEVVKRFAVMPFTLRAFEDEKNAKLGVTECVKHELLEPFKVMWEKDGEYVAQFKILCLVMPNGNLRCSTSSFDIDTIKSDKQVEDEAIVNLLKTQVGSKNKKKKKNKKKADADAAPKSEEDGADK